MKEYIVETAYSESQLEEMLNKYASRGYEMVQVQAVLTESRSEADEYDASDDFGCERTEPVRITTNSHSFVIIFKLRSDDESIARKNETELRDFCDDMKKYE